MRPSKRIREIYKDLIFEDPFNACNAGYVRALVDYLDEEHEKKNKESNENNLQKL